MNERMTTADRLDEASVILGTRTFIENAHKVTSVPLTGRRGRGKNMVLDTDVWLTGRAAGWPATWILVKEQKSNKEYVRTTRQPVSRTGKQVSLARLIVNARGGEVVAFRDGNTLNLRLSNLEKMSGPEFSARIRAMGLLAEVVEVE